MSNQAIVGQGGLAYRGTNAPAPPNCNFANRAPTPADINFSLLDLWLFKATKEVWILVSLAGNATSRGPVAVWAPLTIGAQAGIFSITGNDSIKVLPDVNGNFNLIGVGAITVTTGAPTAATSNINVAIAAIGTQGVVALSTSAATIAGTNGTDAVTPLSLTAKLGTQTVDGIAYGNDTTHAIQWTAAGPINSVLVGTGLAPEFSDSPSVEKITILNLPVDPTDGANKEYVDSLASGFTFITSAFVATTGALTATYANGAAGVGATLTNAGVQAALTIDGQLLTATQRVLVKNQAAQLQNGIYTVTTVGTGATNWVLTRATDYDAPGEINPGDLVPVTAGTVNAGTSWLQTETVTTVGTDPIIFIPFTLNQDSFLLKSANLSDVASASTSRTNLGLTNVAIQNVTNHATLVGGAANAITSLSLGSAGAVLTSNGPGMDPSYQTLSAGSGALILIQTQTASNSASLIFTSMSNTYVNYLVTFTAIQTDATGSTAFGTSFSMNGSVDSGVTFFPIRTLVNSDIYNNNGISFQGTQGQLTASQCTNQSTAGVSGEVNLYNVTNGNTLGGNGFINYTQVGGGTYCSGFKIFSFPQYVNINALQFVFTGFQAPDTGQLVSGTISMYGYVQ